MAIRVKDCIINTYDGFRIISNFSKVYLLLNPKDKILALNSTTISPRSRVFLNFLGCYISILSVLISKYSFKKIYNLLIIVPNL